MERKSDLSLFRNELKGLAILGVILCHMKLPIGEGLLKKLLFYGIPAWMCSCFCRDMACTFP